MEKTQDVHPLIYHYTKWESLRGILENNTLWATNVRYLNDTTEYHLVADLLIERLLPLAKSKVNEISQNNASLRKYIDQNGGVEYQANKMAHDTIRAMYQVTGDDFYVVSFCGTPKDAYEEQNGLLSQWRGYGNETGFCLVFDTKKLLDLLSLEVKQFYYGPSHLSEVVYSHEFDRFDTEMGKDIRVLIDYMGEMLTSIVNNTKPPLGSDAMVSFHQLTTRFKHRAYFEEHEVRIVAAPTVKKTELDHLRKAAIGSPKNAKSIRYRQWRDLSAPYIEFFGKDFPALPIKKIIVGPGRNNETAMELLGRLALGRDIAIEKSDMPFV